MTTATQRPPQGLPGDDAPGELRFEWRRGALLVALFAWFGPAVQRITSIALTAWNGEPAPFGVARELLLVLAIWLGVLPVTLALWFLVCRPRVVCTDRHLVLRHGELRPKWVELAAIRSVRVQRGKLGRQILIEYGAGPTPVRRYLPAPVAPPWPPSSVARFERQAAQLLERMGRVEEPSNPGHGF